MADLAEVLLESTPQQSERFSGRDIFTLYPELKDKHLSNHSGTPGLIRCQHTLSPCIPR